MKSIGNFFAALWLRLETDAPPFFKKLQRVANYLIGFAIAAQPEVVAYINSLHLVGFTVPSFVHDVARGLLLISLTGRFFSSLPVDPDNLPNRTYKQLRDPNAK